MRAPCGLVFPMTSGFFPNDDKQDGPPLSARYRHAHSHGAPPVCYTSEVTVNNTFIR